MTVLIGLLCKDGVVIGADSSATFGNSQQHTIEQKTKKIEIINKTVMVAGTGEIGLFQRFTSIVKTYWNNQTQRDKTYIEIGTELAHMSTRNYLSTLDFKFSNAYSAQQGFGIGALLAFHLNNNFYLCEYDHVKFQPEFKNENIWYVSMGSGQMITDPFLGFFRQVFWGDALPTLNEGIFYVTWALKNAIDLNTGGINAPLQIAVLEKRKGLSNTRILDDNELVEHEENVNGAIKYLSEYKKILRGEIEAKDIP